MVGRTWDWKGGLEIGGGGIDCCDVGIDCCDVEDGDGDGAEDKVEGPWSGIFFVCLSLSFS